MKTLEEYKKIMALNVPYKCKLDDIFFFGKHKNKTIEKVLSDELSYLKWCVLNIAWFEMSDELKRKYHQMSSKRGHFIYQEDYKDFLLGVVYPEAVLSNSEWFEESLNNQKRIYYFLENKNNLFDDYDRQYVNAIYDKYLKSKNYNYHADNVKSFDLRTLRTQINQILDGDGPAFLMHNRF